jgi:fibronectin-binding autotransporter adhesin
MLSSTAFAADGVWDSNGLGFRWSDPANWSAGTVTAGSGSKADLSQVDLSADTTVRLDAPVELTELTFGDKAPGSAGNVLTFSGAKPTITVDKLGAGKTVTIGAVIAGKTFAKAGPGALLLAGANTYTEGTSITGTLQVTTLANGGVPSIIGASTSTVKNLTVNNRATLSYVGSGGSTDRLFQTNTAGQGTSMTLEASGSGPIKFTATGAVGWGLGLVQEVLVVMEKWGI